MYVPRHHFKLESLYGPPDLFKALKHACEDLRFRKQAPTFEFDWMKRKIVIVAATREGAQQVFDAVAKRVQEKAGPGLLLPGKPVEREDGRVAIPAGVLLQTPDIYTEVLVTALAEFGVKSITYENDRNGFSLPLSVLNRAMEYEEVINTFPLPGYLKVVDEGEK